MAALLSRPTEGDLLTPSGAESAPIGINVDAAEGEVVITVENRWAFGAMRMRRWALLLLLLLVLLR